MSDEDTDEVEVEFELLLTKRELNTIIRALKSKVKRLETAVERGYITGVKANQALEARDFIGGLVREILAQKREQKESSEKTDD